MLDHRKIEESPNKVSEPAERVSQHIPSHSAWNTDIAEHLETDHNCDQGKEEKKIGGVGVGVGDRGEVVVNNTGVAQNYLKQQPSTVRSLHPVVFRSHQQEHQD